MTLGIAVIAVRRGTARSTVQHVGRTLRRLQRHYQTRAILAACPGVVVLLSQLLEERSSVVEPRQMRFGPHHRHVTLDRSRLLRLVAALQPRAARRPRLRPQGCYYVFALARLEDVGYLRHLRHSPTGRLLLLHPALFLEPYRFALCFK